MREIKGKCEICRLLALLYTFLSFSLDPTAVLAMGLGMAGYSSALI